MTHTVQYGTVLYCTVLHVLLYSEGSATFTLWRKQKVYSIHFLDLGAHDRALHPLAKRIITRSLAFLYYL